MNTKVKQHYINGHWIDGRGDPFTSINPANNALLWTGSHATAAEISNAVNAAHGALRHWSQLEFTARAKHIEKFCQIVESRRMELTTLISEEAGKPLWESATEVSAVISKGALSIQAYLERTSEKKGVIPEGASYLRYKPHGVVAVLGPFNFPAHLSNGHIIPALLAGNTVVYKPSELTPAVAEWIMQCWHESHLPAGVINCIQGGVDSAIHLLKEDIQGVYFTGSYNTGVKINQQFSARPDVILALEMGGNNPLIIDEVTDINAAVYQTILSSFITAGQRCTCARRVLIADNAKGDDVLAQLINATKRLHTGAYTNTPEPFMGPVISHQHALSHLNAQQALIKAGGNPLIKMALLSENTGFLSPGIIDMSHVVHPGDEEIFAPLIQVYRYKHFDDALALANQTRYGLAAGLLSSNKERYQAFYHTVRAGLMNWNRPTTGALSSLPFGGIGNSGNHRPSAYFAADYCAYPIASLEQADITLPQELIPGIAL